MTWRFKLQPRLLSRVFLDGVAGGLRHRRGESIARRGRPAEIGPAGRGLFRVFPKHRHSARLVTSWGMTGADSSR